MITISGQSFLTKSCFTFCAIIKDLIIPFSACCYWRLNDPFCSVWHSRDPNAFHWAVHTPKFPLPVWDLDSTIFGLIWVSTQMAAWPVQPFCKAHGGKQTDSLLLTSCIAVVRILTIATMRPNNYNNCQDDVSGASIMASHCEFNEFVWWRQGQRPLASSSQTKCTFLGYYMSVPVGFYRPH